MSQTIDLNALDEALRSAFPNRDLLSRMLLLKLGWKLDDVAGTAGLLIIVPQLLQYTESQNTTARLLEAAHRDNPGNPLLRRCYECYFSLPESADVLEKIVHEKLPLLDFADWLKRQQEILGRVCRIEIDGKAMGTGFLVGKSTVLTNYHVIETTSRSLVAASQIACRFDFTSAGASGQLCKLTAAGILASSPYSPLDLLPDPKEDPGEDCLDFALLQLAEPVGETRGIIPLRESPYSFLPQSPLFIVQHPEGEPIRLGFDTDAVLQTNSKRTRVRYRTNTLGGSSGSPCFNLQWELVALHHSGDPKTDARGKKFGLYNEGVPIDRIYARLKGLGLLSYLADPGPLKVPPVGSPRLEAAQPSEVAARPHPLVFCHAPGDSRIAAMLEKQLAGLVQANLIEKPWSEAKIPPGANTKATIQRQWNNAEIILLLVSADFLANHSEYLDMAKERHAQGATVIPIVVRPALWNISWIGSLHAYPRDSDGKVKPVSSWSQADDAMFNVIEGLQQAIEEQRASAGKS